MTALRACRRPVQLAARLLLFVMLVACAVAQAQQLATIPKLDSPVVDTTGTLDASTTQALENQALVLQQRKGSQLQVLMVPTTQPEDIAAYTQRVYDQWTLGRKDIGDGLLIVVAKDDRRVRIQPGYGLEGAIPDATAERVIQEYLVPKFRADDFGGGIADAVGALVKLIDGEPLPAPMADNRGRGGRSGGDWMFALFAAFIVAQVARGMFRGVPKLLRGALGAVAAGGVAWLLAHALLVGGIGALIGLVLGIATTQPGRYARHGGWGGFGGGGGGWGGGMGGGGGGGGWSGGGGMSGGGGASGSW